MADQEQLARLKAGVAGWNHWRLANSEQRIDLQGVDLFGANLEGVNLAEANLRGANLFRADLKGANLAKANLTEAKLAKVNLRGADLFGADLRAAYLREAELLIAKLHRANLGGANLFEADLFGADLAAAKLPRADLFRANFKEANLERANLIRAQAVATNFEAAILTGACLKDWNTNRQTNFRAVKADYIYLGCEKHKFIDRRPHFNNFQPSEFAALFQQALDTLDLIFIDGIDWKAFFASFQKLRQKYSNAELNIQAIEKKSGGSFVVRLEISKQVDKAEIERAAKADYEQQLKLIEARYQAQLEVKDEWLRTKDEVIEIYRKKSADMTEIAKSLAKNPPGSTTINVDASDRSSNQSNYGGTNFQSDITGSDVSQAGEMNINRS